MMTRMAIGISHPAGRSRTCSENGRRHCVGPGLEIALTRVVDREEQSVITLTTSSWCIDTKMVRTMTTNAITHQAGLCQCM